MVSRIDGTKNTDLVGEIIRNKTSHKKLISFLYEIVVLKNNSFELVVWTGTYDNNSTSPFTYLGGKICV